MKQILILLTIFVGFNSWTQSDSLKKDRKIFFKAVYAPLFPTESVKGKTASFVLSDVDVYDIIYSYAEKKSNFKYSYQAFLMGEVKINNSYNLEFGLGVKSLKFEVKKGTPISVSSKDYYGNNYNFTSTSMQLEREYYLISLPIIYNYKLNRIQNNFSVGLGASFDIVYNFRQYINGNLRSYNFNRKEVNNQLTYTTLILKLGYQYRINRNLSLGVDPFFSYSFNPSKNSSAESNGFSEKIKLITFGTSFVVKF